MAAIVTEPIAPLQLRAPWVPPQLARIVTKALSRDRRERYRDAGELCQALLRDCGEDTRITRSLLRSLPSAERTPAARVEAPFLGDDQRETRDLPEARPVASSQLGRLRAPHVAAVAVVLGMAGYAWHRPSQQPAPKASVVPHRPSQMAVTIPPVEAHEERSADRLAAATHAASALVPPASSSSVRPGLRKLVGRAASATPTAPPLQPPATATPGGAASAGRQRAQLSDAVDEFR